ncbi:winged helix-turn-helix domain-containing protein [Streptomyces canus]|uniref:winged helix-turn-helix domain-containing protein n=1 Tax=Streptomyces canus TaxID=58343 RepID=UPI002E26FFF9
MSEARSSDAGGAVQRVLTELRGRIVAQKYPVGGFLPPQRSLAEEFKVSRDTVQRALQELKAEGWIESRQGSGSRVISGAHNTSAADSASRMRTTGLGWFVERAFEQSVVKLDVYSLTSESLDTHLRIQAERILTGGAPGLERIELRMLLPTKDMPLPFPRSLDDPDDMRVVARLRSISDRCLLSLTDTLHNLRANGRVEHAAVQVRRVPVAPMFKLYLLNGKEAFHSAYELQRRRIPVGDAENVEALDVLSVGARGTYFVKDDTADVEDNTAKVKDGSADVQESLGDAQSAWVDKQQRWFNSLWTNLAASDS